MAAELFFASVMDKYEVVVPEMLQDIMELPADI
jgi:hypothetical protein